MAQGGLHSVQQSTQYRAVLRSLGPVFEAQRLYCTKISTVRAEILYGGSSAMHLPVLKFSRAEVDLMVCNSAYSSREFCGL